VQLVIDEENPVAIPENPLTSVAAKRAAMLQAASREAG
jgi:hypothetical protein